MFTRVRMAMFVALFIALPAIAEEPPVPIDPVEQRLASLATDLRALSRIAEKSKDLGRDRDLMLAIIDEQIESLREPRSGGSFRWAALEREEESRVTREQKVEHARSEAVLNTVTLETLDAYRVVVDVPPKKSLFHGNEKIFVRRIVAVERLADGSSRTEEIPVDQWVEQGGTHAVVLPRILGSALLTIEMGVESGSETALAKVSASRARLADDPKSPFYPAVTRLVAVRRALGQDSVMRRDVSQAIDEAIATIPGEVEQSIVMARAAAEERRLRMETGALIETIA
ncbi:MAG TPA: hypothetical protein VM534_10615, partial [Thermoanaerobaculia bacterium]|nr:hypothetical protein [Thermoanaerobaculia bacterium]